MNDEEYWKLSETERRKQDLIDSEKTRPKVRWYLWDYCKSYGWRPVGMLEGYDSLEDLKNDGSYKFDEKEGCPITILKAEAEAQNES